MAILPDAQIAAAARGAGFTGNDLVISVAVALAESGGNPENVGGPNYSKTYGTTYDYGLWQINSSHKALLATGDWRNPADNARMAYSLYTGRNKTFGDWSVYKNGRYVAYMGRALVAVQKGESLASAPTGPSATAPGVTVTPVGVTSGVGGLVSFAAFLANPNNWLRMGYFIVGMALVFVALARVTGIDNAVAGIAKKAALAYPPTRAVAAAL